MEVKNVKKSSTGQVLYSFDISFPEVGVTIRGCSLIKGKSGQTFVSWPSRKYQDTEGKDKFFSYVWADDPVKKAIDRDVMIAIEMLGI